MGKYTEAAEALYGEEPTEPEVPVEPVEPSAEQLPQEAPIGKYSQAADELYAREDDPFSAAGRRKQAERFAAWKTANEGVSPERATEIFYLTLATGKKPKVVDATLDELKAQIKQGEIETQIAGIDELQKLLSDASTRPMAQDDVTNLRGLWGVYQRMQAKAITKGVELIPLMLSAGAEALDKGPEANAVIAAAILGRGESGEDNQKSLIEGMRLWWRYTHRELSPWGEEQAEEMEAAGMPGFAAAPLAALASLPGGQLLIEQEGEPTDAEFLRQATAWVGRASKRGKKEGAGANLMIAEELERYTQREFGEEGFLEGMITVMPAGAMELFWDHAVQAAGAWVFGSLGAAGGGSAGATAGGAPAAPGAVIGGLAGALGTGIAWDTAQAGPQLYLAFRAMRNPDGTRMHTDDEARKFAWLTAAGSGVVTGLPGVKILEKMPILGGMIDRMKKRSVKALAKKALGEVGEEIIEARGTQKALLEHLIEQDLTAEMARKKTAEFLSREGVKQIVKDGLTQVGTIGTWTALNYSGQGAAHATGIEVSKATKGYEFKASNILDQALDTMWQGLHDTMLVMSLGPGRASISRMMNVSESRAMGEHLTDIIARAEESKLRGLAPVVFEQFAKETAERSGEDAIYVDLEVFNAGLEKLGEDPAAFSAAVMGDDGRSYRQAVRTGGKVQMPFSTYTARILGTEADAGLRAGMTLDEKHSSPAELERLRALGDKVATAEQSKQDEFVGQVRQAIIDQTLAAESNLSLSEIETSADLFAEQIRTALEAHSATQQEGIIEQIGALVDALNLHGPTSPATTELLTKRRLKKQAEALARVDRVEAKEWAGALEKKGISNALELAALRQKADRLLATRTEAQAAENTEEVTRINAELSAINKQYRKIAGLAIGEAPKVEVEQEEVGELPETAAGRIRLKQEGVEIHEATGLPLNADGTVTLYHGTTQEGARSIEQSGRLVSAAEPSVYLTTDDTGVTGYGDVVVELHVDPDSLLLDDEFPSGRRDFKIDVDKPGGSAPVRYVGVVGGPVVLEQADPGPPIIFPDEGGAVVLEQSAYHGTPHKFDKFTLDHIGEGEGAQSFGWGLYFAESKGVADFYRAKLASPGSGRRVVDAVYVDGIIASELSPKERAAAHRFIGVEQADVAGVAEKVISNLRRLAADESSSVAYREALSGEADVLERIAPLVTTETVGEVKAVEIPDSTDLLDYDKLLGEQPEKVKSALKKLGIDVGGPRIVETEDGFEVVGLDPAKVRAAGEEAESLEGIIFDSRGEAEESLSDLDLGVTGEDAYRSLARKLKSEKAASEALRGAGIPGLQYLDQFSRGEERGTHNFVIWDEEAIRTRTELEQGFGKGEDAPRGQLTYTGATGEQHSIDLMIFAKGDVSTLTHELFHFFGLIMQELAANPDAPQTILDNYDALAKFMGYESGAARSAEKVTEYEERGSYAWEQYLAEGKAPTSALAPAFHAMKRWMLGIWRNFVSRGEPRAVAGVKQTYHTAFGQEIGLTDEVRDLFDRLLAGEDVTNKAAEDAGLIFDPVLAEMMDDAERAAHEQEATEALGEVQDQLASQVQLDLAARGLEDSKKRITEEVKEALDQDLAYRADHYLKTGLHLEDVRRQFSDLTLTNEKGEAYGVSRAVTLRALQEMLATGNTRKEQKEAKRQAIAFLGELPDGIFSDLRSVEDSAQLDAVAQTLGFSASREMLAALKDAEPRSQKEVRLIQEGLAEEFGDIITNPEGYAERAAAAVNNPKALKFLLTQLNTIRKKLGYDVEVINTLENQAQRLIDEMPLSALSPARFRNQEAQAAARAMRETEAGNWDDANAAKTEQILNALLARKAVAVKKKTDSAEKKLKQAAKDPWRVALGKADPEQGRFLDPNDAILQAVGIMDPPQEGEDVPLFSPLRDVVAESGSFIEADGSLAFDDALIEQIIQQQKPWKSLTTTEALEVRDAIRNIRALANDRRSIDVDGERRDLDASMLELENGIRKELKRKGKLSRSDQLKNLREKLGEGVEYLGALMRGMEFVIDHIDGDDLGGPMHRFFWDGYISARNRKDALAEKHLKPWARLWQKQFKKNKARLMEPANTKDADGRELLPMTLDEGAARDGSLSRMELVMVLFNLGNGTQEIGEDGELHWATGNIQRLLDGRGWKYEDVIQAIEQTLSPEEVMLVQKGWAALEGLAPMVNERHKQAEGLPMGMVKPRPLTLTIDGKKIDLTGGYFPAAYSPTFSAVGKKQEAEIAAPGRGKGGFKTRVQKNFTKRRADKVSQMISLKFDTVVRAFEDHLHYIAFSKWVVDAQKVLDHPRIEKAMREHLGEQQTPFLAEFVKAVAGNSSYATDVTDMKAMSAVGFFRNVFASIVLGLSAPVALGDEASVLGSIMDFDDLFSDVSPGMRVKYIAQAHTALFGRKFEIDPETGEQTEPSALVREIGFSPAMEEAQRKSPELRYRANRNATRYSEALKRMGITSEMGAYFDFMYVLLEQSDMRASAVIWTAAYNMAIDQGHDPGGEAIKRADKLTRRVQPKIGPELSPVMRKKYLSLFFAFFGFMNNHGNRLELMARRGLAAQRDPTLTSKQKRKKAAAAAGSIAAGYLVEIMIGDWFSGHGPDKDEEWDWGLISLASIFTRYVPIVGDLSEALTRKALGAKGPQMRQRQAPNLAMAEMLKIQADKILTAWTDGKLDEKDALVAITALFSMLPRRPQGSAGFAGHLFGKATGIRGLETKAKIRTVGGVPNPGDVLHGLLYGAPYSGRFALQSPFATVGTVIDAIAGDTP